MSDFILNMLVEGCYTNNQKAKEKEVICNCGWKGKREDAKDEPYNNMKMLSGSAGIIFKCPDCGETVDHMFLARS